MRKTIAAGVVAGFVLAAGFAAPAQAISATTADLSVLHAMPGLTVDVYVNGALTLDDFEPGDLAGPLDLPAGDVRDQRDGDGRGGRQRPRARPATVTLAANTSYTATANLTEAGEPALNLFTNDTATTAAGEGRLTVRHVAAAPAVDILAGGTAVVSSLVNPDEATLNLPVGTVSAAVALAGTTDPVIGPADVAVEDGKLTDRLRVGQRRGREPRPRRAEHHGRPLDARWRQLRHRRLRRRARRDEPGVRDHRHRVRRGSGIRRRLHGPPLARREDRRLTDAHRGPRVSTQDVNTRLIAPLVLILALAACAPAPAPSGAGAATSPPTPTASPTPAPTAASTSPSSPARRRRLGRPCPLCGCASPRSASTWR